MEERWELKEGFAYGTLLLDVGVTILPALRKTKLAAVRQQPGIEAVVDEYGVLVPAEYL